MNSTRHTRGEDATLVRARIVHLRAGGLAHVGFLLIAGIACVGAFLGLDNNSLWLDELFTAYFSDPAQSSLSAVLWRGTEDIHPPLYYLLVHLIMRLGGDFALNVRGLSAVLGVAAIGVVYMTARRNLSPGARAFACAFASTSWGWWWYVQEARSYALCFFLGTVIAALALLVQRQLSQDKVDFKTLAALVSVCLLGAFVHYYMVLLAGGVFSALLIVVRGWRDRAIVIGAGLTVLVPVAAYVAWQLPRISIEPGDTWFLDTPMFTLVQFSVGMSAVFGSFGGLVVLMTAFVLVSANKVRAQGAVGVLSAVRGPVGFPGLVAVLTLTLGLLLTWLTVPMFSHRLFIIVMPFVWLFSGHVFERMVPLLRTPVLGIVLSLLALLSTNERLAFRFEPLKEEWRNSAAFIKAQPACSGAVLPVVIQGSMTAITGDVENVFYDYYLRDDTGQGNVQFLPVQSDLAVQGAWQDLIRARVQDTQSCPVLLWLVPVNKGDELRVRQTAKSLNQTLDLPSGRSIDVVEFKHIAHDPLAPPFLVKPRELAKALIIRVRSANVRP